jgi:hypothetical protein
LIGLTNAAVIVTGLLLAAAIVTLALIAISRY